MCNVAIANIAKALSFNETVKVVNFGESLSAKALAVFLMCYVSQLSVRSGLEGVIVGYQATPGEMENEIIRLINLIRLSSRRCPFQVMVHVDMDDDDFYSTSRSIAYTGFKTFVADHNGKILNMSDAESDEHSDSDERSDSDEHSDSGGKWNSDGEWDSDF